MLQRGFTLLEVLISISLLMIVIALAGMAMRMGINAVTAGEKKIDRLERFRSSLQIISCQISSEIPLMQQGLDGPKYIFHGEKDELQIPTSYSIWNGWRGYVLVDYEVTQDKNGKMSLTASENGIGAGKKMETMLFSDMDHISFQYAEKRTDLNAEIKWLDKWEDNKILPEKVKLNIAYGGGKYSFVMPLRSRIIGK